MIDLNCKAAVDITMIVLKYMNRNARMLETCFAAAFKRLPGFNVYAVSKVFLYSFSRSLGCKLFPRHIKVTAVCPNWVKPEFIQFAKILKTIKPSDIFHSP